MTLLSQFNEHSKLYIIKTLVHNDNCVIVTIIYNYKSVNDLRKTQN